MTEENAPKVVIENGSFESLNGCIIDMYSGIVEIFNGEFTTNRDYTTIYMDTDGGYVDLHIHNGSFTADEYSSISTSGGNVTIDNGTFSSNEGTLSYYDNDYQDIAEKTIVTINGGTFKSQGITIDYDGLYDDDNEAVDLVINGGSFESANEFALVAESGDIRINGGSFQGKLGAVKIMDKEDVTGLITGGSFKATGIGSIGYVGAISLLKDFPEESITSYFNDITIIDPDTINEDYVLLGDHYSTTSAEVVVKEQKNITITKSTYGEVSVDNLKHYPGDKILVTITPELGYELDTISIVSKRTNTAISLASDNSFILPNEDVTITATFKASQFEVTTGEGQNITIPEDKTATFVIDADYSLFKGAYVDNKALVEGTDCVTKEGSTIITLQEKLLNSLEEGEHELKVLFTNDTETITNFTIEEAIVNPSTYDGIFNTLVLGLISLIFVVSSFFSIKKKRTN